MFDLRKHMEEEQKDALGRERQKLDKMTAEKRTLEDEFKLWSGKYLEDAGKGIRPLDAARIGEYINDILKNIKIMERNIKRQEENVETERLLLIDKMKDRKTIETLYDKQRRQFIYDETKKEEKEIEELITSRR